ncbi:MAG: hypothetical protein ABWJ97_08175 [Thermoproteus sp.]
MDLLCARELSCTPADHKAEAERAERLYPLDSIMKKIAEAPRESMKALSDLRNNRANVEGFGFLSGSLLVECTAAGRCAALQGLVKAGIAEDVGGFIYIPYTALSEQVVEYLPVEEEEAQTIKRPYVVSVAGIGGGDPVESFSEYLKATGYLLWGRIERVLNKISYIPQLINKYNTQIDILIKLNNKYIVGIRYVDINKTVHMGFSAVGDYLRYGLDYAVLLHPFVDVKTHRRIANRIGELEIASAGYMALDILNEVLYIYKMPKYNTYLRHISIHSQAMALRSYIESL